MLIISPLEPFLSIELLKLFYITNTSSYLLIIVVLLLLINLLHSTLILPLNFSNWINLLSSSFYCTLLDISINSIDKRKGQLYFNLIFSLFHIILFSNLLGLITYSSTSTVEIVITLSVALALLVGVLLVGFLSNRLELFAAFIPAGTPLGLIPLMILLEWLAYSTRTLSLGLRLAVNMITGHILAKVCVGFIWIAFYIAVYSLLNETFSFKSLVLVLAFPMLLLLLMLFQGLEILIAYLQAYIFTFITCITIKDMSII